HKCYLDIVITTTILYLISFYLGNDYAVNQKVIKTVTTRKLFERTLCGGIYCFVQFARYLLDMRISSTVILSLAYLLYQFFLYSFNYLQNRVMNRSRASVKSYSK